ncbi:hypothetical protein GCM10009122_13050 [Fulvivirga kasyanovii]|uniref:hypothetical protein n=1 Tax=Fulvivirga kasyanovii TaxID=396812 RepID=UPI0031DBD455
MNFNFKELITSYEANGQQLIIQKNKSVFFVYAIIMMVAALIFFNAISRQNGTFEVQWPFYLIIIVVLIFSAGYFKTAITDYKIVFNKASKTISLNDGNLISFDEVSSILITFKNTGDTHYCYLELTLKSGKNCRIIKSDCSLKKNIESTANKISTFIEVPITFKGRSLSYFT